jgi:hypothetical protein
MSNDRHNILMSNFDIIFEKIFTLETVIKLTLSSCKEKEIKAEYYNITFNNIINLSEERNNYINMLTIALEKLEEIKTISSGFENEYVIYNKTPTIAADK